MDQIVSQILDPVVKSMTDLIRKHLGYVISFTKHETNMRNAMKELEGKSIDINNHMERNKMDRKEIPARVLDWLNEVKMLKKNVDSISGDANGCLNMKKRYRAGRNAFKTIKEIERLITITEKIEWSDAIIPLGRVDSKPTSTSTTLSSQIAQNDFKSRDKTFKEALEFLRQDHKTSQVIALCGMGGVGKTTMMEQLKKVAHDNKMFYFIVKLVIGRNPDMHSVQKDIAVYLGDLENLPNASISVRADYLCKKIEKLSQDKKRILIILDDVWEKIELKDIGLTSPLPNGVKLLLTSRDSNVCTKIGVDVDSGLQVLRVNILEEAEAQKFFFQITGISKDDIDKFPIGCDIVKKCGCLPLAIKLIASTLKSKEKYEWTNTLLRLKNNDLDKNVQEIIEISYEHIKEYEDKQIFLHCSLFPEDYAIPIEDLTRHAWGLKLLKNVSTLTEARDKTNTCVRNLINANLLISGDQIGYVKMHDLVLSFVLGKVSKGNHAWIINHGNVSKWDKDIMGESCKIVSLTCRGLSHFPIDFKYPNLSLLQLMCGDLSLKFEEDFYEHMKNLEVLAYHDMQYPLLPRSLQYSKNLRTLCLYKCNLMFDCSFVGDLVNLEVLSFAYCGIRKLPSAIGNLRKLKLLDLSGCIGLHIDNGVFQYLENLEELYMSFYQTAIRFTDANLEELAMLSRQLCALEVEFVEKKTQLKNMSFEKLDKFKISVGCLLKYDKKCLFQNTLKLVTDSSSALLDYKISELIRKTEKLHLQVKDMTRLEDVSHPPYNQQSYFYLRYLVVSDCPNLIYLFPPSVAIGLRKLERLEISKCSVLEAIVNNYGSEIRSVDETIKFEKLKFLSLEELPKFVSLFLNVENVVELPELVELEVNGLPNFTSIYPGKNNDYALEQPFLNSQVVVSKLKKLKVKFMEKLTRTWACSSEEEVHNIFMLREIEVEECDSLVNLFPTNPVRLLNHLERLTIKRCDSIESIFNIDMEFFGEVERFNSSLRHIEVVGSCNLREIWRIKGGENKATICGFEAVESIMIYGCKRFRNVFTPTNTKFDMRAVVDIDNRGSERNKESQQINVISSEKIPEAIENIFNVAFASSRIPTLSCQLSNLHLTRNEGVEVVFEISNGESTVTQLDVQQQMPVLPFLQDLWLKDMEMMTHVWKCDNWNKFLFLQKQHPQSSFHSLTTITVHTCKRIKYLFSPLMATLLSNLHEIKIWHCEGMEEIVSNRDDKDDEETTTSTHTHTTTNLFPHLHSLYFGDLPNLKRIGGYELKFSQVGVGSWSLCQYPRKIRILSCDALSSVIPSSAVGKMQNLQELDIGYCKSLIEVFESEEINNNNNVDSSTVPSLESINSVPQLSTLKKLKIISCDLLQHVFTFSTLDSLRQLEELRIEGCNAMKVIVKEENEEINNNNNNNVGSSTVPSLESINSVPHLSNLKKLVIISCNLLQHVFTFSTLDSLRQLEELRIEGCNAMKVIVKEENEEQITKVVMFPHLKSLGLVDLPNLEGFFLGKNIDFQWPSLEKFTIDYCPQMMVFTSGWSTTPKLKYLHTTSGKYSLETDLNNFHMTRDQLPTSESTSLSSATLGEVPVVSFHNLIEIDMEHRRYEWNFSNIIPSNELLQLQKLERIRLHNCGYEEVFDEPQTVVEVPNLRQMELEYLYDLKSIWKSNNHHALEFPNLTTLNIHYCNRLEHVFTSSMVGSLLQLQDLHIEKCDELTVIVKEEESKFEGGAKVKEIVKLPCLKSLRLERLNRLQGFCLGKDDFSLPLLDTLEIWACNNLTAFTKGHVDTPALNVIDTGFGRCHIKEDLNSFIRTKQQEGFQF